MKKDLNIRIFIALFISFGTLSAFGQQRLTPYGCYAHKESEYNQKYVSKCFEKILPVESFQFAYMVLPSFENEYALSRLRHKDELVLTKSQGRIWMCSEYKKGCPIKTKTFSLAVPNSILDSINALFKAAVLSSSYVDYTLGVDGVTYMFMGGVNGETAATCWSPYDTLNCARLVAISERICKAVETQNAAAIESLLPEIYALTKVFRKLLPESAKENAFLWP